VPERATVLNRSEKSAEAVVVAGMERRAERVGGPKAVSLGGAVHQKPAQAGRNSGRRVEAAPEALRDEASTARHDTGRLGRGDLLTQALATANMAAAWKRVKANRGSAGVDGRSIAETAEYLRTHWPRIREAYWTAATGPSRSSASRSRNPTAGYASWGFRQVTDRLIQQALLQVLQPKIDPTFSEHSHGFRPGRRAHDAVLDDVDLEKFFDRVNHDILMERLSRRIDDKAVLRLIRRYLLAGIMDGGVVMERHEGTPQGGPLSPLLANVLLDEVDRELEHRDHRFVRYADDYNVYVRSRRAGERVLGLRKLYDRLHLKVNEAKTSVAPVSNRKFVGYAFWYGRGGQVKCKVAGKALRTFKQRIREMTRRSGGRSLPEIAERLRAYMPGWKAYFQLAQTPNVFRGLDEWNEWVRHRLARAKRF